LLYSGAIFFRAIFSDHRSENEVWVNTQGRVRSLQNQKKIKDFFCLFSKTFESKQLSKNCECKQHFYPVISPVKSHPKMRLFVDICKNLASINLFY
jgi:hypothetical protein